jgi:uncharacterized protein (DUF2225 family)
MKIFREIDKRTKKINITDLKDEDHILCPFCSFLYRMDRMRGHNCEHLKKVIIRPNKDKVMIFRG